MTEAISWMGSERQIAGGTWHLMVQSLNWGKAFRWLQLNITKAGVDAAN